MMKMFGERKEALAVAFEFPFRRPGSAIDIMMARDGSIAQVRFHGRSLPFTINYSSDIEADNPRDSVSIEDVICAREEETHDS